ncbi:MAG: hypothetical protein Q8O76_05905, partial [Chloroflexota bacterium]|nr:hypothetical protein [Chloroflexota bacterium]
KDLQSALLFVDSYVTVTVEPGVGSFAVNVATPVFGTGKKVTRITLDASWPYLLTLIAGTYISPPGVGFQNNGLMRVSDTTLTKTAALGTADSFGSIKFVPRWGTKTLDQTLYGVAGFFTGGAVQKFFIVRNLSVATVEVRVQGGIQPTLVEGLEQLGLPGYVQDPDIHPAGSATENFVSIAAGGQAILETGLPYGIIRMQARVAAAMPAALTARLVIEFAGITTAGR